jgi:arylsulfatase A-like enzyme
VLTDDQRFDMLGSVTPYLHTPNLDRLAGEGVRFENAFVTSPVCAASRASILTSTHLRTHRHSIGTPPITSSLLELSYPVLLRAAGYQVGYVGKWDVRAEEGVVEGLFDVFEPLHRDPYLETMPDGTKRHLTDITIDRAIAFLSTTDPKRPFALSISFNAPHAEDSDPLQFFWPDSVDHLYRELEVPRPPLSHPAFFQMLPAFLQYRSLNRQRWYWRFDNERKRQMMTTGYYRMVSGIDAALGRLLAELERRSLDDDTVIVVTSDNGYFLGERGWAGKWKPHDVSIRVPLLVFDPELAADRRAATPAPFALDVDLAPTLLDYAGIEPPPSWQGRSLRPIIEGSVPENWRTDFFHEYSGRYESISAYEGVRTERFSYARYPDEDPVYEELYDMELDPDQGRNLIGDPKYADVLEGLQVRCAAPGESYSALSAATKPPQ